jgi:uncharacterized protein YcbK (DUF882 family)
MGDLSKHFSRSEFECKCGCGYDTVDSKLIELLEKIRTRLAKPIKITSGCRCHEHNAKVGGSLRSQHKLGRAADIIVTDVDPAVVYRVAEELMRDEDGGIGKYEHFTHIDSRNGRARWIG